jgi:hypothetical protein
MTSFWQHAERLAVGFIRPLGLRVAAEIFAQVKFQFRKNICLAKT